MPVIFGQLLLSASYLVFVTVSEFSKYITKHPLPLRGIKRYTVFILFDISTT